MILNLITIINFKYFKLKLIKYMKNPNNEIF